MKRFYCTCGNEVFFDNQFCQVCGQKLGFDPETQQIITISIYYRLCEHNETLQCNWLVTDSNTQCIACRLTRTIPLLSVNNNKQRWLKLEATKRRAFYMLLRLGLNIPDRTNAKPMLFDFLEDQRSNPDVTLDFVYTGHADGVITLNVAEADDSYRSATQELMNEAYRTLLGHFRHELGHFYWLQLFKDDSSLAKFRELFGDERQNYKSALEQFYQFGATQWQQSYITAYASSHPLEDWAETWAHYLHINDTLETARAYRLIDESSDWLSAWMQFSIILNALNRSMGTSDPYPFVISEIVQRKLQFIADKVRDANRLC
jgi:hypothetical protein